MMMLYEEDLKLVIGITHWRAVYWGNKSSKKRNHFLIRFDTDSFWNNESCPLWAIRKNAGLRHFYIGFTFQTLKLHPFVYGIWLELKRDNECKQQANYT